MLDAFSLCLANSCSLWLKTHSQKDAFRHMTINVVLSKCIHFPIISAYILSSSSFLVEIFDGMSWWPMIETQILLSCMFFFPFTYSNLSIALFFLVYLFSFYFPSTTFLNYLLHWRDHHINDTPRHSFHLTGCIMDAV